MSKSDVYYQIRFKQNKPDINWFLKYQDDSTLVSQVLAAIAAKTKG